MKQPDHYSLNDVEFLEAMEKAKLDPKLFSHEAHLRWGWLLLEEFEPEDAIDKACEQLENYTRLLGIPQKFNKTVTVAAIKAIHHFKLKSQSSEFKDFMNQFPRLKSSFRELMGFHYSLDIFSDGQARKEYVEPDLLPFD